MIPILYGPSEKAFTSNGIGFLIDAITCTVTEERNGLFELEMSYPVTGQFYSEIKLDRIVLAKCSMLETRKYQPFRIYKISKPISGRVTIYGRHISYQLSSILTAGFSSKSPSDALQKLKTNAQSDCPFTFSTDISGSDTEVGYSQDFYAPIRSCLGGSEGSILDVWNGEYEWDQWNVILHEERGTNRGVVFRYGKDITDMTQEGDIGDLVTRIFPYYKKTVSTYQGYDEITDGESTIDDGTEDIIVTLSEKYLDTSTVNNYSYPRVTMLDLTDKFEETPTEDELRAEARKYLAKEGLVNENNEIEFIPPTDVVELCDTVGIENRYLGISTVSKVVKVVFDVLKDRYEKIEVGDLKSDFSDDMINTQNSVSAVENNLNSLAVDILKSNAVITQRIDAHQANFDNLVVRENAYIERLTANEANITDLQAETARIDQARITDLSAVNGRITNLETVELSAVNGRITNLDTVYANIVSLLAGNAGVGDLQTIQLTTQNANLDSALVNSIIAQFATINDLVAGKINTDNVQISSADGGVVISGATQTFYDKNGTVRMQIGKDANGNFTFALYDSTGQGQLIDQNGIHASAISDGLIVDKMVADDANISEDKLNIAGIVRKINDDGYEISSTNINLDGQTLTQRYTDMNYHIALAEQTAQSANEGLQKALDAISGIDTLTALNVWLSNDAHVVHTLSDGTGGDFSDCNTTVHLYLGDTEVTQNADQFFINPSEGVEGTWNAISKTYQVTNMTTYEGYVDIGTRYGMTSSLIGFNDKLVLFNGKLVSMKAEGITVFKRFSISKSPDGRIGLSYRVDAEPLVMLKQKDGSLVPPTVTFTSTVSDDGVVSPNPVIFEILESADGATFTSKYKSSTNESSKVYTPSSTDLKAIKAIIYGENNITLDSQSVLLLTDADGVFGELAALSDDVGETYAAVQSLSTKVGTVETGIDGLRVDLGQVNTDVYGIQNSLDKTILYSITHKNNTDNTTTVYAHVWKECKEVTKDYPEGWFTWSKKTEFGEEDLGEGYEITVNNDDFELTGVVIGRFTTYELNRVLGANGKAIAFNGKLVNVRIVEI